LWRAGTCREFSRITTGKRRTAVAGTVGRRGGDVRAPGGRESKQRDLALAGRARVGGGVQLNFYF